MVNTDVLMLHLRWLPDDSEDLTQELATSSLLFPLMPAEAPAEAYLNMSVKEKRVMLKWSTKRDSGATAPCKSLYPSVLKTLHTVTG